MKFIKYSTLLTVTLLAGCAPEIVEWTPAESPKENKVERSVFYHTIQYPSQSKSFSEREADALLRFLKLNAESPSAVSVVLEECDGHSQKRIKDIQRVLVKYGISYDMITVEPAEKAHKGHKASSSGVCIVLEKYLVIPPSCADFSQPIGEALQAHPSSNFGCATTANLGMMVANPRDLVRGRPIGASDGTVMAAGVKRYRDDKVKALIDTSTTVAPGSQSSTQPTSSTSTSTAGGY